MNKYLVIAYTEGFEDHRIAALFETKKEAIATLNRCIGKNGRRLDKNLWEDSLGQRFYIEKK